ncbi:ATP-dependent helicase [Vibrio parahaemolyticus]|uniref:DNA 3'-5' helicase n=2 Tax=Unclassified Bacteria TaxID=49928 RepID=A0AAU6UT63_UNCXX|nr:MULTISPECIES: ATP-dependent helicase [Vibrio]EKO3614042.1 ATP-dependent helicase [Vibrio metschnikovii]EGQ9840975.1 ATP-dependent helicase [Vibrio parahaemolyticus]EIR5661898.1 ATP-dependent helicase [Vibrio parahaemolyticus]EJE4658035.1 ATP-dependent helicase [Vibrio parahaemolyticus]EJE4667240.1 ATP-dependent helicase [Vibrio parahaemolyticus]
MINLSDAQLNVVQAPLDTALQVLASAGSGKTRVLTERVRYILSSTKKESVIALTFTNKAAEEMQTRLIEHDISEERFWVGTIHSVAQRVLEQYGHTIGLPSELHIYERDKDRMEVFMQSLRDDGIDIDNYLNVSNSKELRSREQVLSKYMDAFSLIKRDLLSESDVLERFPNNNKLWKYYEDYQRALLNSNGIDFDDILLYSHKILLTQDWVGKVYRAKYKHLCVDEAQDLNGAQYEFIKAFCGNQVKSVLMVGDPNQMIYGFNGSSSKYLTTSFVDDFSPLKMVLNQNYRSTRSVIEVANRLKPGSQRAGNFALQGMFDVRCLSNEQEESNWIVDSIKNLLSLGTNDEIEGGISLDKMVVIARNRFVFKYLEEALQASGIDYHLRKGERRNEPTSLFGKVLDYSIRLKLNPKDWVDGIKLCNALSVEPPSTWGDKNVLSLISQSLDAGSLFNKELLKLVLVEVDNLNVPDPNVRKLTKALEVEIEKMARDGSLRDSHIEELKLSMEELQEFWSSWVSFRQKGLGESLLAYRNAISLGQVSETKVHSGLTLSTVHTMKGLEKDIVFLMGMCEGVFPDYRATSPEKVEEERNNAFVAVTRAKRWLYVSYPQYRVMPWGDTKYQAPSRFINEMTPS